MELSNRGLHRRMLLMFAISSGVALCPPSGHAESPTGVDALDTPSISVKRPDGVLLEAITRAAGRLVAVGEHGVIVYSDDNGGTWAQASVPVNVTLTSVAFATPFIGWAAGNFGVILYTADGGKTWQEQLNGIKASQLMLSAAQDSANLTGLGAPLALKRANIFVQDGPDKPFLSIVALSSQKIIAFGAYRMTMMTLDGGQTWMDWSLRIGDRFSHNLYAAARIGTNIYVVAEEGLVFCSSDDGNSFPEVTSPSPVTLFGLLGASDGSIIVFGVAGSAFRSADCGKSWLPVHVNTQDSLTAGRILRSGMILIASEAGGLFKSTDNGASFTSVPGFPPQAVFDFEQAMNSDLIFVGTAGAVRYPATLFST